MKRFLSIYFCYHLVFIANQCFSQPANKFNLLEEKEAHLERSLLTGVQLYDKSELFKYHWDSSYQYVFNELPAKDKINKIRHVRFRGGIPPEFAKEITGYPYLQSLEIDGFGSLKALKDGLKALNKSSSIKYLLIKQDYLDTFCLDKEVFTLISRLRNLEALFVQGHIKIIDRHFKFSQSLRYLALESRSKRLTIKNGFNKYQRLNYLTIHQVFHKGAELIFHEELKVSKAIKYLGILSPLNNKNSFLPGFEPASKLISLIVTGGGFQNELNLSNCEDLKILKIYGVNFQINKDLPANFDSLQYIMLKTFAGKTEASLLSKAPNVKYLYLWGCFENLTVNLNKNTSIFTFIPTCQLVSHEIQILKKPDSLFVSVKNFSSIPHLLSLIAASTGIYFEGLTATDLERLLTSEEWNPSQLKEIYLPSTAFQLKDLTLLKKLSTISHIFYFHVDQQVVNPEVFNILPNLKYLRDE